MNELAPLLQTPRLSLRRITIADAPFLLGLLNEPSFIRYIGDRGVRTRDDAQHYIRQGPLASYQRYGFGLYLVELRELGTPIGICGLLKREQLDDVDLGFALLPAFCSQGYALEAARAVKAYAHHALGLRRLVAIAAPDNDRSARLLVKLGFTFERMIRMGTGLEEVKLWAEETDTAPTPADAAG